MATSLEAEPEMPISILPRLSGREGDFTMPDEPGILISMTEKKKERSAEEESIRAVVEESLDEKLDERLDKNFGARDLWVTQLAKLGDIVKFYQKDERDQRRLDHEDSRQRMDLHVSKLESQIADRDAKLRQVVEIALETATGPQKDQIIKILAGISTRS